MRKKALSILVLCIVLGMAASVQAVTIRHLGVSTSGQDEWLKEMARRFEEETGIKVMIDAVLASGLEEHLILASLSGTLPDAVSTSMAQPGLGELVVDLRPFIAKDPDFDLNAYAPAVWADVVMPPQSPYVGAVVGLPYSLWTYGAAVNTIYFEEDGIDIPAAGWTWQDLRSLAIKLSKDEDGDGYYDRFGWSLRPTWTRMGVFLHHGGGQWLDDPLFPKKSRVLDEAVRVTFDFVRELSELGVVHFYDERGFARGVSAMSYEAGSTLPHTVGRFNSGVEFDYVPFAQGPSANTGGELTVQINSMLRTTEHPEETWEWLKFISYNYENQVLLTQVDRIPAVTAAVQVYFQDMLTAEPSIIHLFNIIADPTSFSRPYGVTPVGDLIDTWIPRAIVTREISLDEALSQLDALINVTLKK